MALRTPEQVQQFLAERRRIKERQKELELKRYRKAKKKKKKELARKYKAKTKQMQPVASKTLKTSISITIYHSNIFEREPDEENLYDKYELQHIEELYPYEEGRLNWDVWDEMVESLRNTL